MRLRIVFTLIVLILSQAIFVAYAHDTSDGAEPATAWEEFYVQDIDVSGFMDRLYVVLSSEDHLGKYPEVAQVADVLKGMGFFDLTGGHTEYEATGDHIYLMDYSEFDHSGDTYYSQFFGIEDKELRSARYVSNDDYLMYFAMTGLVDKAMLMLNSPTISENGETTTLMDLFGEIPEGDFSRAMGMVKALQLDKLLGQILSGELALVVYNAPDLLNIVEGDIEPSDIDAALMIGIDDPDYLTEMIGNYGSDIGLAEIEIDDPAWHGYRLEGEEGVGFAYNDEILIASPSFDVTALHVGMAESDGGLDLPACQCHLDIDMERLHNTVIHPAVQMLAQEAGATVKPQHESMMYLFNVPEPEALGNLTITGFHPDGNAMVEMEMKKAVLTYLAFYLGMGLDVAAQAGAFN